jgi:hypothetical protein
MADPTAPAGPRFLVVVPTHRLAVAQATIDELQLSFTYPTEFHILDGTKGKCHAINAALVDRLRLGTHDIYCTVDDDLIMSPNWQHFIACAFDRVPKLGVCGVDYRGSKVGEDLMSAAITAPIRRVADIEFRDCTGVQNVAGGCLAMPAAVAKKVGPFPLANDGRIYHLEEDSWRCHRAITLGYRIGYVSNPNGVVQLLDHANTPQYIEKKAADIAAWQSNPVWS